jgi:hypothetical protein
VADLLAEAGLAICRQTCLPPSCRRRRREE